MTTCLLCPAPAVADGLCVEDGAQLWAAEVWIDNPNRTLKLKRRPREMIQPLHVERHKALCESVTNYYEAQRFLARLEEARALRPVCPRKGCSGGPDHG